MHLRSLLVWFLVAVALCANALPVVYSNNGTAAANATILKVELRLRDEEASDV